MIFSICCPSQKGEAGTALVKWALASGGYEQVGHISVCNLHQRLHAFMKCAELDWISSLGKQFKERREASVEQIIKQLVLFL